jgi:hypothetical protein
MVFVTDLALTLAWLRSASGHPVKSDWVPGATDVERKALRAIAGVASHLLPGPKAPASWPEAIRGWLENTKTLPPDVSAELDVAVKEKADEALAYLYASVVAGARRRVLGTFFTPAREVTPMLAMWSATQPPPTTIVDVGAGVGVFTAAATRQWRNAHVVAVDVNPVTLGLLGVRMTLPDVDGDAARTSLVLEDFTTWFPSHTASGRLILGNPPYTRSQLIPPKDRGRLLDACGDLCGSRASLSAVITALTLKHLRPDDGLCLLLPAQWLESTYAARLRRYLLGIDRRRVELRLAKADLFDDAVVDAVVLLVGTERNDVQPFVVFDWEGKTLRTIDRANATVEGWRTWFEEKVTASSRAGSSKKLSDVAILRRGTATGANEFFVMSAERAAEHDLPAEVLKPVLRRLSIFDADRITNDTFKNVSSRERTLLLLATEKHAQDEAVAAYVAYGEDEGFHNRHLCKVRTGAWFDVTHDLVLPDVVITAMSRGGFRVVENGIGAAITNNLYGWRWRDGVTKVVQERVLAWLRGADGQAAVLARCRSRGDGLAKVEPLALAGLELPVHVFE